MSDLFTINRKSHTSLLDADYSAFREKNTHTDSLPGEKLDAIPEKIRGFCRKEVKSIPRSCVHLSQNHEDRFETLLEKTT